MVNTVMSAAATTVWIAPVPESCEMCKKPITNIFVDGRIKFGPWAIMCQICHRKHGCGLGVGRGQKYGLQQDRSWKKIA